MRAVHLAAQLLRDAAVFFRNVGEQNPGLASQMADNAEVYDTIADRLDRDAHEHLSPQYDKDEGGDGDADRPTMATLAARLLDDAAVFFSNVGRQNPDLGDQMSDNAEVYHAMATLIRADPQVHLPTDA